MPRRIVTQDGSRFWFAEYTLPELQGDAVRVQVQFAAPKHGTEKHLITGSPFDRKQWDPELRMFLPPDAPAENKGPKPERGVGNMVVGDVTATGPEVTRYNIGDRVFGYGPIQEEHQASESDWHPLGNLACEDAVCVDPAHVAFVGVRDGNIRVGDNVAVHGLGAIGLMAVQIARAAGAQQVFAVDPIALRRACAEANGADKALDPAACDAALEIKRATGDRGVDVAVETSGNGRALQDAIRCIQQCGTVVHVPWGPHDCTDLHLDEEFHLNRPTLIASQAWSGWGNPDRNYPLWTHERAYDATIQLFRDGKITGKGVIAPIVPFEQAPEGLRAMFEREDQTIKIGVSLG